MRRITKAALGGLAGCALVLGGTQVATGALVEEHVHSEGLVDLMTDTAGPLDGVNARATLLIKQNLEDGTQFTLNVEGIDPSASGVEFGSHLHIGKCVRGVGSAAKGHYNDDQANLDPSPEGLHKTEVWFDLVPDDHGNASDDTYVPFVPRDTVDLDSVGEMSIVIHMAPTDHQSGFADSRQACLPLYDVKEWASVI